MISILFTRKDSIYKTLGVDCWDIERDAMKFKGDNVVICHPPCRLFSRLRGLSTAPEKEKQLAYYSLELIRKNGGILEHPYPSLLWKEKKLPIGNEIDEFGGYTVSVNQNWFGAKFLKKTLLYIVGVNKNDLPDIPLNFNAIEILISQSKKNSSAPYLRMNKRDETPIIMAKWLIEVAETIAMLKNKI